MESFALEQPLCDFNESMDGLTELWDSNSFDSPMGEDLVSHGDDDVYRQSVWSNCLNMGVISSHNAEDDADDALAASPMVIFRDRLITDAAVLDPQPPKTSTLDTVVREPYIFYQTPAAVKGSCTSAPVKSEHSYSLFAGYRSDDVEIAEEMQPPVVAAQEVHNSSKCHEVVQQQVSNHVSVKLEPLTAPNSPANALSRSLSSVANTSLSSGEGRNRPSAPRIKATGTNRMLLPRLNVQFEKSTGTFILPPTPPSSTSSDSEGSVSPIRDVISPKMAPTCSQTLAEVLEAGGAARLSAASESLSPASTAHGMLTKSAAGIDHLMESAPSPTPSSTSSSASSPPPPSFNRQSINSPLISYQPKGSTGTLQLTEEEKRTLLAEGYPVPSRLPLTKAEEKSLKKIRRKIKNKISAQESRRKKKEYMDTLERRASILEDENADYRHRLHQLESDNMSLQMQLKRFQQLLNQAGLHLNLSAPDVTSSVPDRQQTLKSALHLIDSDAMAAD